MVESRLAVIPLPTDRYVVHAGFVETTLADNPKLPNAVSFAFVDFDFHQPTAIALDFIHTVLSPGGIIVVDDYDWFSTGCKTAVDEFVAAQNAAAVTYSIEVPHQRYGHLAILTRTV